MKSSLAVRMFAYFVIVILISSSIVGFVLYVQSSKEVDKQTNGLLTQIVDNAMNHTDMYLKKYDRATLSVLTSTNVKEFLNTDKEDFVSYFLSIRPIKEKVIRPLFINNPEISMVYLLGYNGLSIYDHNADVTDFSQSTLVDKMDVLKQITNNDGKLTIMDWSFLNGKLALTRKISDRQTSKVYKGILGIELNIEELTTLWKGIRLGETGYFYIVNDNGNIVYHPNSEMIGKQLNDKLFVKLKENQNRIFTYKDDIERVHFNRRSDYSGWTLVASMPLNELRAPVLNIRNTTLFTCSFTLIIALFLAYRFGNSIIKPIKMLESGMRRTEKGDWAHVAIIGRTDEMDRLIVSYNKMVSRLQELMEQVYAEELKNKEYLLKRQAAEFQALQLQINPHFLYNTFETIVCYAVVQDSQEIKEIVRSLSYMMRYSVRADLEEITVANELKHVLHFMNIMNYRLGFTFEIEVLIPPELLLKKMVRLTLQPLVENVFKHAFPDGIERHHQISINAFFDKEDFVVTVMDNGAGIPPDRLRELETKLHAQLLHTRFPEQREREGGIGLVNVHSRIQIVCGERYGLSISNNGVGTGTKITLRMPSKNGEPGYPPESASF
ncbi:HAMP domain-containing protein [Paenibacillus sp. SYP-B3998]|uniref:histidine kinase n=1 Tax=Paenibacillus sp. SYP-B3998 TaxID=2678564 RepID=A0A6G3ZU83_9BACL|nr:sensor histidine kinase [Paenibacillus sp. SYP-B3998]NEW05776.1 HAMP domain-containing protein [Paenibacillus sp. SYP-B3998]